MAKHEEFLKQVKATAELNFHIYKPGTVLKLLAIIEKLKSQRDLVLRAAEVDELGYGAAHDYDKWLDEIAGQG